MTESERNQRQLVVDALPSPLRDPVSLWFERFEERYPDAQYPNGSLTPLVRTVAISEQILKALAELYDITLGDLLEGIVLHAFEGRSPFDAQAQQHEQDREAQKPDREAAHHGTAAASPRHSMTLRQTV